MYKYAGQNTHKEKGLNVFANLEHPGGFVRVVTRVAGQAGTCLTIIVNNKAEAKHV